MNLRSPPRRRTAPRPVHPVVANLRQARYDQGITAAVLAEITGYSSKAIYQWEAGISQPRINHLHDWAQALGMTLKIEVRDEQ